jgi:hypothetical protein
MNKKQIIQLVVILLAFGGAGFVLYRGGIFGTSSAGIGSTQTLVESGIVSQPLLPYGETLDFKQALDADRFNYNQFEFGKLDPKTEVGIDENLLIVPTKEE